jgi:hypothetical protein
MRAATLGVLVVAGCASSVPTPKPAPPPEIDSPAAVGLAYSTYLYAGAFARASSYVLPGDRDLLTILFTGLGVGSVRAEHLGIGDVAIQGSQARLVLTGTICSSGAAPSTSSVDARSNEQCLENHDARSDNPAFRISTCKSAGRWYVCFPRPNHSLARTN